VVNVADDVKPYLDYLDKEMTIMGILSAFCVGAAALVAREVLKVSGQGQLFAARQDGLLGRAMLAQMKLKTA
jgi:hypothetical protein